MGEKKKKRKLSAWNIFIRDHSGEKKYTLPSGSPDLKAMSRDYHGGSSKKKPKSKSKAKPQERTRTTKKKATPKKRRLGDWEKKVTGYYQEFLDFQRALRVKSKDSHFHFKAGTWRIRIGSIRVKRKKLGDAMKALRKKVKTRI